MTRLLQCELQISIKFEIWDFANKIAQGSETMLGFMQQNHLEENPFVQNTIDKVSYIYLLHNPSV